MARVTKQLTNAEIKNAKAKEYKLYDGRGLHLLVVPSGGKRWKLKYTFQKKNKTLSLGLYPDISLSDARELREKFRKDIANGVDPNAQKKLNKILLKEETKKSNNTIEKVVNGYFEKRIELNEAYLNRLKNTFKNNVFPIIGSMRISDVEPIDIIKIVKKVEERGAIESAHRLFTQISKVFKYAVSNQFIKRNICNDMDKNEILKSHTTKHYPTITDEKSIGELLTAIDEYTGDYTVKMALKLAPYVFLRPFNIRYAQWEEIDFELKQWKIEAKKMKTKKEHIIPLTDTMLNIFKEMKKYTGDAKYIFPSLRSKMQVMSDATLNNALRRMGYSKNELVVHGFRAMFSTIAHEKSGFSYEAIETQLAHSVGNSVSRAYNRALYLDERKKIMQWWSDYLDALKTENS